MAGLRGGWPALGRLTEDVRLQPVETNGGVLMRAGRRGRKRPALDAGRLMVKLK